MYNKSGAKDFLLDRVPNINPHDVAGIVKLYFRELPEPLCGELFEELVSVSSTSVQLSAQLKSTQLSSSF